MEYCTSTIGLALASDATAAASPSASDAYIKPKRVVLDNTLYVYDHCPFCVRVRLALGMKNVKHNLHFLANDDVHTPTKLVGKKIAPIFVSHVCLLQLLNPTHPRGRKFLTCVVVFTTDPQEFPDADIIMAESMDIIEFIDNDERFGPTNAIRPASGRSDLKEWQKSVQSLLRTLQRPRYVATGLLPEFQQKDARHAFIVNHQLPPYDKEEWKSLDKGEKLKIYEDAMAADPAPMIEELNARLVALDDIVYCEHFCTEGGLSLDDIDLWARLRSISIIRGVQWPSGLRKYMDNISELADLSLYDALAM